MDSIKVAVMSDIHSNLYALNACLKDAAAKKVQEYIVLGDIVNIWNRPNECADKVRNLTPFAVKGLSEQKINDASAFYDLWHLYDEFSSYIWTEQNLTDENYTYLRNLPKALSIHYGNLKILAVHGSPYRMSQSLQNESEETIAQILERISENILLCGESHAQWKYEYRGKTIINPGSVGCHYNPEKCAEYAVIELSDKLENVEFVKVRYNIDALFSDYLKSDLYKEGCIDVNISYIGMKTGSNDTEYFNKLIKEARSVSEYAMSGPVPNDIYNNVYNKYYSEKLRSEIVLPLEL